MVSYRPVERVPASKHAEHAEQPPQNAQAAPTSARLSVIRSDLRSQTPTKTEGAIALAQKCEDRRGAGRETPHRSRLVVEARFLTSTMNEFSSRRVDTAARLRCGAIAGLRWLTPTALSGQPYGDTTKPGLGRTSPELWPSAAVGTVRPRLLHRGSGLGCASQYVGRG